MAQLLHRCAQLATRSVYPTVRGRRITSRFILDQFLEGVEYFRVRLFDRLSSTARSPDSLAIPINEAVLQLLSRPAYRGLRKT